MLISSAADGPVSEVSDNPVMLSCLRLRRCSTASLQRLSVRWRGLRTTFSNSFITCIDCIFCLTFSLAHKIWLSSGSEFLQRHHFRWPGLAGLSMLHDAARLPLLSSSFRSVECWGCRVCRGLASKAGWLLHAACGSYSAASLVVQTWFCFLCLQASRCVACVSRVWVVCVSLAISIILHLFKQEVQKVVSSMFWPKCLKVSG